jgi:hypothetical protein
MKGEVHMRLMLREGCGDGERLSRVVDGSVDSAVMAEVGGSVGDDVSESASQKNSGDGPLVISSWRSRAWKVKRDDGMRRVLSVGRLRGDAATFCPEVATKDGSAPLAEVVLLGLVVFGRFRLLVDDEELPGS